MNPAEERAWELALIRRTKAGDTNAYEELVRKYEQRVYGVAYRMVRNSEDARDIAQEAFIAAFEAIGTFKEEFRFYTWLYRITVNRCLNFRKKQARTAAVPLDDVDPGRLTVPDQENPDRVFARRDLKSRVEQAIELLPVEQRAVLVLRVYEELSYEEIADALRIPIGTVMSRLGRARQRLKEILKDVARQS